jgi:hypothetical protein
VVTGADPTFEPRIRWAPKLRADKLVRLYATDAASRRDDELLADVGWSLYSRLCDVRRVVRGEVACPRCQTDFVVRNGNQDLDTMVSCPSCGWETTRQWHKWGEGSWCTSDNALADESTLGGGGSRTVKIPLAL